MPHLHLLQLTGYPILSQLQLEEALLRADDRNWCLVNVGSPPAIVLGISGDPQQLINPHEYAKDPLPLIRRFSGGGTVVVDEATIFVTFIINKSVAKEACCPKSVLHWTASFYAPLFANGLFSVQENDYALGDRKFGGNAQYFCKERWLHHSTLLWDYNPARMRALSLPAKRPSYRRDRMHDDFLSRLCRVESDKESFINRLCMELGKQFSLTPFSLNEIEPILMRPHRKSTTIHSS